MRERASKPRVLHDGFSGGWMRPPPSWGCDVTSTASMLAFFTPDHVDADAILMLLLENVQEFHSPGFYLEIARRVSVRGGPRDLVRLWVWCAAAGGDALSQRRIAYALKEEAAGPAARLSPARAAELADEWMRLRGGRPWDKLLPEALDGDDPFPVPEFEGSPLGAPAVPRMV